MSDQQVREGERPVKCARCGNWPQICGHGLSFAEKCRLGGPSVDRTSLQVKL